MPYNNALLVLTYQVDLPLPLRETYYTCNHFLTIHINVAPPGCHQMKQHKQMYSRKIPEKLHGMMDVSNIFGLSFRWEDLSTLLYGILSVWNSRLTVVSETKKHSICSYDTGHFLDTRANTYSQLRSVTRKQLNNAACISSPEKWPPCVTYQQSDSGTSVTSAHVSVLLLMRAAQQTEDPSLPGQIKFNCTINLHFNLPCFQTG